MEQRILLCEICVAHLETKVQEQTNFRGGERFLPKFYQTCPNLFERFLPTIFFSPVIIMKTIFLCDLQKQVLQILVAYCDIK